MKLTKKEKIIISIILTAIISTLFVIYVLISGSEEFAMINIDKLDSINDPMLKTAIETTKECSNLEAVYKKNCYNGVAEGLGYYYGPMLCEKLKEEIKQSCYFSFGLKVGEENIKNLDIVLSECSKTEYPENCIAGAYRVISQGLQESKLCDNIPQGDTILQKHACYQGFGRGLAKENKDPELCKKTLNEETCLLGYGITTDQKGNRQKSLEICNRKKMNQEKCFFSIGVHNYLLYNQSLEKAFEDCEQYSYPENCKIGVSYALGYKQFYNKIEHSN